MDDYAAPEPKKEYFTESINNKPYNQVDEQKHTIEKLKSIIKEQRDELLNLYRRIHG